MINKGALKFFYFINLDFVELCLFIEFDTIHLNDGTILESISKLNHRQLLYAFLIYFQLA